MIIKLKYELQSKQVHVRVFMGPETHQLSMCGSLMLTVQQFDIFNRCLKDGSLLVPGAEVILSDSAEGSSSSFPKIQLPFGPENK
jgi:hypothetical protein